VVGIFLIIMIGMRVKGYVDSQKLTEEMVAVVRSEEARDIFERTLKKLDPNALTSEGFIQSYEIDDESIKGSPMGSIMVNIIINGDSDLIAKYDLNKRAGKLKYGGIDLSGKLSTLKNKRMEK